MSLLITKAKLMEIIYEEIEEALDPHRTLDAQAEDEEEYKEPGDSGLRSDTVLKTPKPPPEEPDPYPVQPSPQAYAMAMDWYRNKHPKEYKNFINDKGPQQERDHSIRTILGMAREIDASKKKKSSKAPGPRITGATQTASLQQHIKEELDRYLTEVSKEELSTIRFFTKGLPYDIEALLIGLMDNHNFTLEDAEVMAGEYRRLKQGKLDPQPQQRIAKLNEDAAY